MEERKKMKKQPNWTGMGVVNRLELRDLAGRLSGLLNYLREGTITALVKYNALKPPH